MLSKNEIVNVYIIGRKICAKSNNVVLVAMIVYDFREPENFTRKTINNNKSTNQITAYY